MSTDPAPAQASPPSKTALDGAVVTALLETAQDAILLVDAQGHIVRWNGAAQRLFDYTAEQALGADVHELLAPPEYRDEAVRGMAGFCARVPSSCWTRACRTC